MWILFFKNEYSQNETREVRDESISVKKNVYGEIYDLEFHVKGANFINKNHEIRLSRLVVDGQDNPSYSESYLIKGVIVSGTLVKAINPIQYERDEF